MMRRDRNFAKVAPIPLTQAWITVHLDRHTAQTKPAGETLNLKLVLLVINDACCLQYDLRWLSVIVTTARDRILEGC